MIFHVFTRPGLATSIELVELVACFAILLTYFLCSSVSDILGRPITKHLSQKQSASRVHPDPWKPLLGKTCSAARVSRLMMFTFHVGLVQFESSSGHVSFHVF